MTLYLRIVFSYLSLVHHIYVVCKPSILGQNEVVDPGPFSPKDVTSQDREAGLCTMSQYPTQAVRMVSGDDASQFQSQTQNLGNLRPIVTCSRTDSVVDEAKLTYNASKRAKLSEDDCQNRMLPSLENPVCRINSNQNYSEDKTGEMAFAVPDVAAAIEDLLEQTSKVTDGSSTMTLFLTFLIATLDI